MKQNKQTEFISHSKDEYCFVKLLLHMYITMDNIKHLFYYVLYFFKV